MSNGTLTEEVKPYELGARSAWLQGRIPLVNFARLSALIAQGDDAVQVSLQFALDDQRRCVVDGDASVGVRLRCLGCVQDVPHALRVAVRLLIVRSDEESAALIGITDSFVLEAEALALSALLEDDLILGLPEIVCGDMTACPNRPALTFGEQVEATSPFGALGALLGNTQEKKT